MPRPYSFDHFQMPKTLPQSRSMRRRDKEHLAQQKTHAEDLDHQGGLHYGKSHAETEEILQARAMEKQLEELARPEPDAKFSHGSSSRPVSRKAAAKRQRDAVPVTGSTVPIGALPPTREQPPRGRLPELKEEAGRQLQAIQGGLGDAIKAMSRLASLPFEVVRLAARRLRPVHG